MFKPTIHACEYTEAGETFTFHVREASGREILAYDAQRAEKLSKTEQMRELFSSYMVNEDGSKYTKEQVDEVIDMRLRAMTKVGDIVARMAGLKEDAEATAKNA